MCWSSCDFCHIHFLFFWYNTHVEADVPCGYAARLSKPQNEGENMSEYIDNSQKRKETLKRMILDLHAGGDLEEIRGRFRQLIGDVSAVEIAQMEQALIAEGLPAEDVKALCDVHVSVFQESLDGQASPETTPGHPVHTFKYENFAAGEVLKLLGETIAALSNPEALQRVRIHAEQLSEVIKIYTRKENLLFPFLEKHGVSGPSSVMWSLHDDIRAQLRAFRAAAEAGDVAQIGVLWGPLSQAISSMFYKEEHILYPTSLKVLSDAEWLAIRNQSDEIGYCLIRPGDQWQPGVEPEPMPGAKSTYEAMFEGQVALDTGALTPQQINLLLTHLPIDVTLIDETDTVRYYSQGPERIFVRTEAIIGRKVQNCHPPASVHVVNKLLDQLKSGARNMAEFWIQLHGQFVYIRYIALRDADGRYRGCIEVTQNIAPLRQLQGERRLLDEG
jgi:DUF438 domain-containing protein